VPVELGPAALPIHTNLSKPVVATISATLAVGSQGSQSVCGSPAWPECGAGQNRDLLFHHSVVIVHSLFFLR